MLLKASGLFLCIFCIWELLFAADVTQLSWNEAEGSLNLLHYFFLNERREDTERTKEVEIIRRKKICKRKEKHNLKNNQKLRRKKKG